jgi:4-hydroxy-3-methylbut-2-enyl diphosphate reductase
MQGSMKVILAKTLGFCMGVRRAVDLAYTEAKRFSGSSAVYTLGPLIHNPKVLADLKNLGVQCIEEPSKESLPALTGDCSVIIRAHGIEPVIENDLHKRGVRIIDATCPNVKASQIKAEELVSAGYFLFIAGEAKHAEIKGIMGYVQSCDGYICEVVGNSREAGKAAKKLYSLNNDAKTALLGQTTISEEEYRAIGNAVEMFFPNLEIIQTICNATKERQQALRELLEKVDAVIVIGGKDSANTRRLFNIAQENNKPCILAEDASQVPRDFCAYENVGLCAGASTPDSVIDEIENHLLKLSAETHFA